MTDSVGSTTFRTINDDMMKGKVHVGSTAAEVTAKYQSETASTAKRVFLGILTLGGYAIYHAVKDSKYKNEMASLCKGTQDFYKNISKLTGSSGPGQEQKDVKGKMCNEKVLFSRTSSDQIFVTFEDKTRHEVKDPGQIVKNIEMDVMAHSEFFDKDFIVGGILKKYKDGLSADREEAGAKNQVYQRINDVQNKYGNEDDTIEARFRQAKDFKAIKPRLAECKEQFDQLLAKLFESRLGLDPAETRYIDRDIGIKLAEDIMDGHITTAADARAFINRNASATHFTTVESAKIFEAFEKAQEAERKKDSILRNPWENNADKNSKGPGLNTVSFADGYNRTGENPALPAGQIKQVHDFVANLVSDLNTVKQDRDLTQDASGKNIADGKMITTGARIRNLFYDNLQTMALLMKNRAECLENPETKSLLSGVEPKFQEALNAELDRINKKYNKEVAERQEAVTSCENNIQTYLVDRGEPPDSAFMREKNERLAELTTELDRVASDKYGRENYLRSELNAQRKHESDIKAGFNTSSIDDISNEELDQLGYNDNVSKKLKQKIGEYDFLSTKRKDLTLGAHFFADMELRLNKAADEGCKDLQTKVSQMIENIFPDPQNKVAHDPKSLQNATLDQIIGGPAEDKQLQLVKEAMKIYFQKMPVLDQRAMLAAEMRYCAINENTTDGAKLGAILKGAGPIMQKMMQGLDPSMFARSPDFQMAISDMKDRLAPISQDAVHAYLYDVVKNSNGAITKIDVKKGLGAASVAQALKCTVHFKDGGSRDCVIKILRPDAEMKARREFAIFNEAAQKVGHGMDVTFKGQFNNILAEMDLTNEAKNVADGNTVYSYNKKDYDNPAVKQTYGSFANVSSMKLAEGIPATKNVMVLEEVPGTTMEQYLIDTRNKSQEIRVRTQHNIAVRGQDNAPHEALDGYNQLDRLYTDVKKKYESLVNLSYMWVNEGLFAAGFYHGDIHKGNIMTQAGWQEGNPENSGITLIDFGNASNLNNKERSDVVKVVAGSATNDPGLYLEGYKGLLSKESLAVFESHKDEIRSKLTVIFDKGTLKDTAARMQAAIKILQEDYAIEVPAAIHNFMESQRRLQNALDDTLAVMNDIAAQKKELIAAYKDGYEDAVKENIAEGIAKADSYKPKNLINAITDVVKQNLYAAMKSIGGARKAMQCYDKIRSDADFQVEQQAPHGGNVLEV